MSMKIFRAKAHDLEQVTRKYRVAPTCGDDDEQAPPDGEEVPEDEGDEKPDDTRDPDPAGDKPARASGSVRPPIRLVARPRPARSRAA